MSETKPNSEDWRKVGNAIRKSFNYIHETLGSTYRYPMVQPGEARMPTEAELKEWAETFPDLHKKILDMAQREAEHRIAMQKLKNVQSNVILYLIWVFFILFGGLLTVMLWTKPLH